MTDEPREPLPETPPAPLPTPEPKPVEKAESAEVPEADSSSEGAPEADKEMASEKVASKDRAAEVQVQVTPDDLIASVVILPPVGDKRHVDEAMVREALAKRKVCFGIKEDVIQKIVAEKPYLHTIQIAEGLLPVAGEDAQLIYHYSRKHKGPDRSVANMGAVDWRELSNIVNVEEEEILLEKIPATPGEPGQSVIGRAIPQKRGQDIRIRTGKGVRASADGLFYHATMPGEVTFRNNQLAVNNVHTVQDVDASTGNIHFNGNVYVAGLVNDGFVIDAKGSVRVDGSVGAATINADGDVFVAGGILGSGVCRIESRTGSVTAKFAQGATIVAALDIVLAEYAKECRLTAGRKISVVAEKEQHGFIVGGRAIAVSELIANNIGSAMETNTVVEVGVDEETLRGIDRNLSEMNEFYGKMDSIRNGLRYLQHQRHSGVEWTERKSEQLARILDLLRQTRDRMVDVYEDYHEFMSRTVGEAKGKIVVRHNLYPGAALHIGGDVIEVYRPEIAVSFMTGRDGVVKLLARDEKK